MRILNLSFRDLALHDLRGYPIDPRKLEWGRSDWIEMLALNGLKPSSLKDYVAGDNSLNDRFHDLIRCRGSGCYTDDDRPLG
jgi:hypothetical protein